MKHRSTNIRLSQRTAAIQREVSRILYQLSLDDPNLKGISVTRASMSNAGTICKIFVAVDGGKAAFEEKRKVLVLYLPSIRTAIAQLLQGRYTPKLHFYYDQQHEKGDRVNRLLDQLKKDGQL